MIEASLEKCDVLLTSGGVSMGEIDLLKPLLEKVRSIKPGMDLNVVILVF